MTTFHIPLTEVGEPVGAFEFLEAARPHHRLIGCDIVPFDITLTEPANYLYCLIYKGIQEESLEVIDNVELFENREELAQFLRVKEWLVDDEICILIAGQKTNQAPEKRNFSEISDDFLKSNVLTFEIDNMIKLIEVHR